MVELLWAKGGQPMVVFGVALRIVSAVWVSLLLMQGAALAQEAGASAGDGGRMFSPDVLLSDAVSLRHALQQIVAGLPDFPAHSLAALRAAGPDGTLGWIGFALLIAAIAIAVGFGAGRAMRRWALSRFGADGTGVPETRGHRIGFLLGRAVFSLAEIAVFALVAFLVIVVVDSGRDEIRHTAVIALGAVTGFRAARVLFRAVLAPYEPARRPFALGDADALGLYRWLLATGGIAAVLGGLCLWMLSLRLDEDALKLMLMVTSLLVAGGLIGAVLKYRAAIAAVIAGAPPVPLWRRAVASVWHVVAVLYFVLALGASAFRLVLDRQTAPGLIWAPLAVLVAAMAAYGLLIVFVHRVFLPHLDTPREIDRRAAELGEEDEARQIGEEASEDLAQARAEAVEAEQARAPYRALLDHGAAIVTCILAIAAMARIWGLPVVGEGSLISGTVEIAVIVFVGYMGYHAVRIALDRQIEKEAPQGDSEGSGEAEFGAGESRLATLLPLFRNFLLITIATMTAMIVLAELGVNIGPIFAGAGVVGLAIGFGAQTLVRDIFSGAFFLIDDAFRKGEYIDIGTVKGTVEKISIRSMQLRHHRGPLNTVPFGEIKFVQNFSRDWAIMKLAFRVTYDTDPEHVRKVIKKLGQELQEHPDYGPLFLQPLKSQGVLAMEDSAMIVRVKFMTRPGDQFTLRKAVYGGIRDAFAREGIKFAHRQVSVRVTQDGDDEAEPLSETAVKQVAGAGARIAEDEDAARQAAGGANKPG